MDRNGKSGDSADLGKEEFRDEAIGKSRLVGPTLNKLWSSPKLKLNPHQDLMQHGAHHALIPYAHLLGDDDILNTRTDFEPFNKQK